MDFPNNTPEAARLINFSSPTTSLIALILGAVLLVRLVRRPSWVKLPPGPFAWPMVGNFLQFTAGLTHHKLADVAKKYGDVALLPMGPTKVLLISSPEMAKEVLQTRGVEFGSRARNLVFDVISGHGQDLVFADYGTHWRKMRRIATLPFFTTKVVHQYRHAWEEEIMHTIHDIKLTPGATSSGIIIKNRLQLTMYNIMYQMMFGRSFSGLDDPLFVQLVSLNTEIFLLAQSFKYNYGDFVPFLKPFLRGYLKDVWDANHRRLAFFRDAFVHERRKTQTQEKIGIDFVLDAQLRGEISETSLLHFVQNMNAAAIETTLSSIEWGVAELVNNPHIQEKLRDELDSVVGKGVPLTEPDLPRLPYLQAMVKETLRMHMVVPLLLPHMNIEAVKLNGYDIPTSCRVLVNAWAIAHNPRYWENPNVFNPERFLDNKLDPLGNDLRYIPFGSGRRSCPGSIIALPLLGLMLGRLVQAFELLPPPGVDKVDMGAISGQINLSMARKSKVLVKLRDL